MSSLRARACVGFIVIFHLGALTEPLVNVGVAPPATLKSFQKPQASLGGDENTLLPFSGLQISGLPIRGWCGLKFACQGPGHLQYSMTQLYKKSLCDWVFYLGPKLFLCSMGSCYLLLSLYKDRNQGTASALLLSGTPLLPVFLVPF